MKVYQFKSVQTLPASLEDAWRFFSDPGNLIRITPPHMNLVPLYTSGEPGSPVFAGQIMLYRVKILPGISWEWMTEITHVHKPEYFVDEQRFGPYRLWHHRHSFRSTSNGVDMTDEINYALPYGWAGRLVHRMFVRREIEQIFEYRTRVLSEIFRFTQNNPDEN